MDLKKQLQKPALTAAYTSLAVGILTHFFGLVTFLHNYDDIAQQPTGYGTGVTSGRWLLSLLGDFLEAIGGNYNLPFINGVLFLILIAASAGFLVSLFSIRSRTLAALTGALLSVFPAAFSTLVFRYTAVYYGLAILLAVLAAWVLLKKRWGLLLSALCTACSLGIYQAYVPMTIGIFVLLLLQRSLDPQAEFRKLVLRGLYYCAALLLGLLLYFLFMKLTLLLYGTQLSDYQGVNQMGKLSLQDLPELVTEAVYSVIMLPQKDYCGITSMALLKGIYILLAALCGLELAYLWLNIQKPLLVVFGLCMCLFLPLAINFIVIMCPDSWIYTLMVYSFVLLPIVPILLAECIADFSNHSISTQWVPKILAFILSFMVGCYCYQTNVNYTALYYSNQQLKNYLSSLIVQVRMAEGFDPAMEWAFIGEMEDPLLHSYWQYEMSYGGIEPTQWMLQRYSWPEWIRNYYGYSIPISDDTAVLALSKTDAVAAMPCWPADGSIQVIDNTIVIKCQEVP